MQGYIDRLRALKAEAAGSDKDVQSQHKRGRLTAQERIDLLFDPGSFNQIDTLVTPRYESYMGGKSSRLGDGVITGFGMVQGRQVFAAAQDATVMGGSLGEM
ncbi:MAG: methylmalonyl-CoA carboxyltransferase, partial [Oscillochloris sp.]|nr:methylmalonyl-CoA carboxyltransferase [Oscillochloris sp.]